MISCLVLLTERCAGCSRLSARRGDAQGAGAAGCERGLHASLLRAGLQDATSCLSPAGAPPSAALPPTAYSSFITLPPTAYSSFVTLPAQQTAVKDATSGGVIVRYIPTNGTLDGIAWSAALLMYTLV